VGILPYLNLMVLSIALANGQLIKGFDKTWVLSTMYTDMIFLYSDIKLAFSWYAQNMLITMDVIE